MLKKLIAPAALAILLLPALGSDASAQGFGFGFSKGKRGKRTNVGLSVGPQGIGFGFSQFGRGRNVGFGINLPVGGHGHGHRPIARPVPVPAPCPPRRVWVPGRYEQRCEQVWVPGTVRREWREPVYRTDFDACGRPIQVLVCAGHWVDVPVPGHYQTVTRQVWIPGHWA